MIKKGRKPDPERAKAIKNMLSSDNVTKLQALVDLARYYSIYIAEMNEPRASFNEVLKMDKIRRWTTECEKALPENKCLLSDFALAHPDQKKELIVSSDTSDYGIGAVLLHRLGDGSTIPISHASRTLLSTERNYCQIEKKSLLIIYVFNKFHRFIHGRVFTLQINYKILSSISA